MSFTAAEITAFSSASVIFFTALGACVVKIILALKTRAPVDLDSIEIVSAESIPSPPPSPPGEGGSGLHCLECQDPESFESKFRRHKASRSTPRGRTPKTIGIPDSARVLTAADIVDHVNTHLYPWMNFMCWVNPGVNKSGIMKNVLDLASTSRWNRDHFACCEFCTEVMEAFADINKFRGCVRLAGTQISQIKKMTEKAQGIGCHAAGTDYKTTLKSALKMWAPFKDVTPPSFRTMAVQHLEDHALTWSHFRGCDMCKMGIKQLNETAVAENQKLLGTDSHWTISSNGSNLLTVVLNRYLGLKPFESAPQDPSGSDRSRAYDFEWFLTSRMSVTVSGSGIKVELMEAGSRTREEGRMVFPPRAPAPEPPERPATPVLVYTPVPEADHVLDAASALCDMAISAAPGPMRDNGKARASYSPY